MVKAEEQVGDIESVKNGQKVYVTSDFKKLRAAWEEAELGKITDTDLQNYCGCPGKIVEIEDDDDTVMLEWLTKDTQWIPITACVQDVDPAHKKDAPFQVCEMVNEPQPLNYCSGIDSVKNKQTVWVTSDLKKLKKEWKEAELGPVDDATLESYLCCPGKIIEIEDDDDTLNLEWATKDSQWIPVAACCVDMEEKLKRHAPFQVCEMVNEPQPLEYYTSVEDVASGQKIWVTSDLKKLKKEWKEAELGPVDDATLESYTCCPGKIKQLEEDDETVMLEWLTMDTQWIPITACVKDMDDKLKRDAPFQVCEIVNEKKEGDEDNAEDDPGHELVESDLPVVEV